MAETIITGVIIALVGGLGMWLVRSTLMQVSEDLHEFKDDVNEKFRQLRNAVDEHEKFRYEFLSKGWTSMPAGLGSGPDLAATIVKLDARLEAIDLKMDTYGQRLREHDTWERQQKWPGMYDYDVEVHVKGDKPDG